jgi:uncharacterized protein YbcC (UPF0753/DUF2309 family)
VPLKELARVKPAATGHGRPESDLDRLRHLIDHAAHLLPAQGPITSFIHHNTLHAFEHLPFDEAVRLGAKVFGCQPYLTEDRFREKLARGRIRPDDLRAVLRDDLGDRADERAPPRGTRFELRLAMLEHPWRVGPTAEQRWFMAETDALRKVRSAAPAAARDRLIAETRRWVTGDLRGGRGPGWAAALVERFGARIEAWDEAAWEAFAVQALWRVCLDGVRDLPATEPQPPGAVRHRDLLLHATGADPDLLVHDLLVRFTAAFIDQGIAHWGVPGRDEGYFRAFCRLYRQPGGPPDRWLRGLRREAARLGDAGVGPLESIRESLAALGVPAAEWEEFVSATLLALRGFGGMVHQVEVRGDRVTHPAPEGSLVEFLAVRLLLDRFALAHTAREALNYTGPLSGLRDAARDRLAPPAQPGAEQRAFPVFHLAQVLGWAPDELDHLTAVEWATLVGDVEAFSGLERRRVFHLAFERRFAGQCLDAVALHTGRAPQPPRPPRFQAIFCIDEREESIRRHLEEAAPDAETFGVAGFFGAAMYYRGAASAHFVPLCPAVIRPSHWVREEVAEGLEETHQFRSRARRALGTVTHKLHVGSRTFARGALVTAALGVLATFPLVARILFPRLTSRLRRRFGQFVQLPTRTRLRLERAGPTPGPEGSGVGFSLDEMTAIAEKLLRDTGLARDFARLVLVVGHGSTSLNNPHESAHDCGACGGAVGGPNARAVAQMLNDPRARAGLAKHGLTVPETTVFVGGLHNTSSEALTFFDVDRVPASHRAEFEAAREAFEEACDRDAHERSRRFQSAPLTLSFTDARRHVEGRAEDLAQVRPEWGHATNALCVVGRRSRTRGLFLDRRAFLNSYDPTQDDAEGTTLAGILRAAVPVCAGISLEYYFSYVDNPGWGCGTKLPHNITSLLGVMDGAASDLRTGLPWQMVEIHEPVRQLFIVETTPEVMLGIMDREETIGQMVLNGWVHLAVLDSESPAIEVYRDGGFRPYAPQADRLPRAASSVDWYGGRRDHLEFAEIGR